MLTGIRRIYRCPYCMGGRGIIAVDRDVALAPRPPGRQGEEIDLVRDLDQKIIVFEPDGAASGPCRHMVDFYVDGMVQRMENGVVVEKTFDFSTNWNHPWQIANDPDKDLSIFLWENLDHGRYSDFRPTTPYSFRRVERVWHSRANLQRIPVVGWFIASLDATRFFAELAAAARQCQ